MQYALYINAVAMRSWEGYRPIQNNYFYVIIKLFALRGRILQTKKLANKHIAEILVALGWVTISCTFCDVQNTINGLFNTLTGDCPIRNHVVTFAISSLNGLYLNFKKPTEVRAVTRRQEQITGYGCRATNRPHLWINRLQWLSCQAESSLCWSYILRQIRIHRDINLVSPDNLYKTIFQVYFSPEESIFHALCD